MAHSLAPRFPGVAVVTGAASGIGAAVVAAFVRDGCSRIVATDMNEAALQATAAAIKTSHPAAEVLQIPGDISDPSFVETLFSEVKNNANFGRVDYAVNCAGIIGPSKNSTDTTLDEFDKVNAVNYRGMWMCSRAELQMMKQQDITPYAGATSEAEARVRGQRGAIVNIASQLGVVGRPEASAYCASKAAVISLTRTDAIDYSAQRIRINAVCPGVIETPMTTSSPEQIERLKPAIDIAPMRRMGLPSEIADAAVFLCSPEASFVQGATVLVDGGYVIS